MDGFKATYEKISHEVRLMIEIRFAFDNSDLNKNHGDEDEIHSTA